MSSINASIIIPVYNNWDLTSACLNSLAATIDPADTEVLVVDNASRDETRSACAATGQRLFGDSFVYIRNEINRNFAGASNQGAQAAKGRYLVFLNNDSEVQSGWLGPLIEDFDEYANLAATGPILAYPEQTPLGLIVQHLGVILDQWLHVFHLYNGIPVNSPLAKKRRFFQAITAACMVIPAPLFQKAGGFDEGYINGFEDVDLCGRLWSSGYRFSVNPASLVAHHESRTAGRKEYEEENTRRLERNVAHHFIPDWHLKVHDDDLVPQISEFGGLRAAYNDRLLSELDERVERMRLENLAASLIRYPFWEKGWRAMISRAGDAAQRILLQDAMYRVFPSPENALSGCNLAVRAGDSKLLGFYLSHLRMLMDSPEETLKKVKQNRQRCEKMCLDELAGKYSAWISNYGNFKNRIFPEFAEKCLKFAERIQFPIRSADGAFYNIWLHRKSRKQLVTAPESGKPEFSILMPVYNPEPGFFRAALDSILAQTWQGWELCLADDASPNPEIREIIREYAARDARIRYLFREKNGHISEATNSALSLATKPWAALMDDDDVLAADALERMAGEIAANPQGLLFYSDEDKITEYGHRSSPHLKNGWDYDLLLHQNYICHFTVLNTGRLREIGGLKRGYEGAQDHELFLRYAEGLPASAVVHVPEILYSWRAHEGSTAGGLGAKSYALTNALKSVQSHLDRVMPGCSVNRLDGTIWMRVHLPVPASRPLVSLVLAEEPFAGYEAFCRERTNYPFEIVGSAAEAKGEILAFLDPAVIPWTRDWLEELVACLWRPGVGAVGGSVIDNHGRQIHAGYMADASGLKPLFHNLIRDPYIGWLELPRTVAALDGLCLLTRKSDFDGLASHEWAFQDYCLRLGERGLRTVWWPFAKFIANRELTIPERPASFKWRTEPFNRNVKIVDQGFALEAGA